MNRPLQIVVLGSGSGSNYQSIARAIQGGTINATVSLVISDVADAKILKRADDLGHQNVYLNAGPGKVLSNEFSQQFAQNISKAGGELIVLAGFMRLLKGVMLEKFAGKIVNIHPSLLPQFKGLHAWEQALNAGVKETGCTVHFVDAGMDTGTIICQARVPVLQNDSPESLHSRIQGQEHRLYPKAIRQIIRHRNQ